MALIVDTNLLSTLAAMGLATLREQIQLVKRTNREYEREISSATRFSTVNVIVPAPITAVSVTPGGVHPNDTVAVTPTKVPVTLDQWFRAAFDFSDKQAAQVNRGVVPMQIAEAIRGLVNKIETNVWLNYKAFYGYAGIAGTTPFAADISEFLAAEKVANDQIMPVDRRALLLDTAANANWKGLRRTYDQNFGDVGAEPAWSPFVPTHTSGTWTNAGTTTGTNAAGQGVVNLTGGTGSILVGDVATFAGADTQTYVVIAATGTAPTTAITVSPNLIAAKSSTEVVTVKASHKVNLLLHPNAIAFAMAPMQAGAMVAGAGATESTVIDNESGLALRLTYFRQFYQDEFSFDALWGSAVPRPELGVRIAG
jgi:hypothetical protein